MDEIVLTNEFERRELRKQRKIFVAGEIEAGVARAFVEDVMLLVSESQEPINIMIIAAPGGQAFSGFAMIRAIRHAQSKGVQVIGSVYGQAMSMAFFLLQCCDVRNMGSMCVLMAHGVTTGLVGDIRTVDAEQKLLSLWQRDLSSMVANRCTKKDSKYSSSEFWFEMLRDNTPHFYSASESLDCGLVDEVDDSYKS